MVDVCLVNQSLEMAERRSKTSSLVKTTKEGAQGTDVFTPLFFVACDRELTAVCRRAGTTKGVPLEIHPPPGQREW
jgi:hypothetical protein